MELSELPAAAKSRLRRRKMNDISIVVDEATEEAHHSIFNKRLGYSSNDLLRELRIVWSSKEDLKELAVEVAGLAIHLAYALDVESGEARKI